MFQSIAPPVDLSGITGAYKYQGTWNATTNSPTLASGVGTQGHVYRVATAGSTTLDGVSSWSVGDHVVFNGTVWAKWEGVLTSAEIVAALTFTPQDAAGKAAGTDIRTGTDDAKHLTSLAVANAHAFAALTDQATITWDGKSDGFNVGVTLGGNRTFGAPTNMLNGRTYVLRITQDATGTRTGSFNAVFDFGTTGAPTLSTGINKVDLVIGTYSSADSKLKCSFWKAA